MSDRLAIELNDTGVIISDGPRVLANSPAYIIDSAQQAWIGKAARERAFLYSGQCENKFWRRLAGADSKTMHPADIKLAMRHLAHIWQPLALPVVAVVLIVPATFSKTGLGILLSICKQLHIPVQAMVHQAVLCPCQQGHQGDTLHADMQLHCSAITRLAGDGSTFAVADSNIIAGSGLMALYAQAAEFIAQEFINHTRLDPLHSAALEQQLHNHLPAWLQASQHNDVVDCRLQHHNNAFQVTINSQQLHAAYAVLMNNIFNALNAISAAAPIIICLSAWVDEQFGFRRYAHKHGMLARVLDSGHYARQSFQYNQDMLAHDGQVYLSTQLPCAVCTDALPTAPDNDYEKPDHVLFGHRAYPIRQAVYLSARGAGRFQVRYHQAEAQNTCLVIRQNSAKVWLECEPSNSLTVNDQPVASFSRLGVGDSIKLAACRQRLTLIRVEA